MSPLPALSSEEAADPSTSPDRLIGLLETQPAQVLENPAFPLLLIEVPELWARLSPAAREHVARSPRCPDALVSWALLQPHGALDLRHLWSNRALTLAQRRAAFLHDSFVEWRWPRARNHVSDFLAADELALLDRLDAAPAAAVDFALLRGLGGLGHLLCLRRADCPAPLLEHIVSAGALRDSLRALRHPNLDGALLARALKSRRADARAAALQNPSVPQSVLDDAAAHPDWRAAAAQSPALSTVWRERFLRDPDRAVRCALAGNLTLTLREQNVLATDPDVKVRDALHANRARSPDVEFVPEAVRAEIHAQLLETPP
jgi:hypothetical protein